MSDEKRSSFSSGAPKKRSTHSSSSMTKKKTTSASTRPAKVSGSTAGSGAPLSAEKIAELDAQLDGFDSDLDTIGEAINTHKNAMAELDRGIDELLQHIEEIRQRGYRYKGFLEAKVEVLSRKWKKAKPEVQREINAAEAEILPVHANVTEHLATVQGGRKTTQALRQVASMEAEIENLQTRVRAFEASIEAAYGPVRQAFYQTRSQVQEVLWILDQVDQASFEIHAEENVIQAVKAKWWRDGKNKGPEGVLYLTDKRLVFEQKEKVATKKVLFVATEKETIQEMLFEAPVMSVDSVKASSKGLMGHQDHLDFEFGSGSDFANAHFHIDGQESEWWAGLVNRVKSDEIHREWYATGEEAIPMADEESAGSLAEAPERCTACGAPFDAPLAKGQRQIQCEYCGTTMRW
jgi:predicted  nucleic acid-binding Zn-ribbon protein